MHSKIDICIANVIKRALNRKDSGASKETTPSIFVMDESGEYNGEDSIKTMENAPEAKPTSVN